MSSFFCKENTTNDVYITKEKSKIKKYMWKLINSLLISMFLVLGVVAYAQAGGINTNEQRCLEAANQSFVVDGTLYHVSETYFKKARDKLSEDDCDLTSSEANAYINDFYGNYRKLVSEGYCYKVTDNEDYTQNDTSTSDDSSVSQASASPAASVESQNPARDDKSTDQNSSNTRQNTTLPDATPSKTADVWADETEDLGETIAMTKDDYVNAKEGKLTLKNGAGKLLFQESAKENQKSQEKKDHATTNEDIYIAITYVMLGLGVLALIMLCSYILYFKKEKKRKLRFGIALYSSVVVGGLVFVEISAASLFCGVFNPASIQRQMMESDYYSGITQVIRKETKDILIEEGYSEEIAAEVVTLSNVYIEGKQYVAKILNGNQNAEISTKRITSALRTELVKDLIQKKSTVGKNDAIKQDKVQKQVTQVYKNLLQFRLGKDISRLRSKMMPSLLSAIAGGMVLIILITWLIYKMYGYPHKAIRMISVSVMIPSICTVVVMAAIILKKPYQSIKASPVYYQEFIQQYVSWGGHVAFYIGLVSLIIGIVLMIWKHYLHIMYVD